MTVLTGYFVRPCVFIPHSSMSDCLVGNELCILLVRQPQQRRLVSLHSTTLLFQCLTPLLSFWELALPLLVVVIIIAMTPDIKKIWHILQKKREAKAALEVNTLTPH